MALGCAGLVVAHPGALVVTVTAGNPPPHALTDWDRKCGFAEGDDVMGARRSEDEAALKHLWARPRWLDFLDRQYMGGQPPAPADVARAIEGLIREVKPHIVASPLGLSHPDHLATAAACFEAARGSPGFDWIVYEDAIYRAADGATEAAMKRLVADGYVLRALNVSVAPSKRAAVDAYVSQVKGLNKLLDDAFRPERYWRVVARP